MNKTYYSKRAVDKNETEFLQFLAVYCSILKRAVDKKETEFLQFLAVYPSTVRGNFQSKHDFIASCLLSSVGPMPSKKAFPVPVQPQESTKRRLVANRVSLLRLETNRVSLLRLVTNRVSTLTPLRVYFHCCALPLHCSRARLVPLYLEASSLRSSPMAPPLLFAFVGVLPSEPALEGFAVYKVDMLEGTRNRQELKGRFADCENHTNAERGDVGNSRN